MILEITYNTRSFHVSIVINKHCEAQTQLILKTNSHLNREPLHSKTDAQLTSFSNKFLHVSTCDIHRHLQGG